MVPNCKPSATTRVIALDPDIASRWGPRITIMLRTIVDATKGLPT
jgi:hypothetical protein